MTKSQSLRLGIITSAILAVSSGHAKAVSYTFTDLGAVDGISDGHAINNVGQVAGDSYAANGSSYYATRWDGTTATELGMLGTLAGPFSSAYAINDAGQVAGISYPAGARSLGGRFFAGPVFDRISS